MRPKKVSSNKMYGRRGPSTGLIILIVVLVIAGVALGIALAWQTWQEGSSPLSSKDPDLMEVETSPSDVEIVSAEESEPEPEPEPEPEIELVYPVREEFPDAVPETADIVGYDYFDDAIFFGDSISTGIQPYLEAVLPEIAVVAAKGLSTQSINTAEIPLPNGEYKLALDAADQYGKRSKVYIMLGSNGLEFDLDTFIDGYRTFIQSVKAKYPGATIYLQGMTPVTGTPEQQRSYPSLNNEKITEYNKAIMALAQEQGVHYLDVAVAFLNEDGTVPVEASPDGVHFIGEYYYKWFDYLKKHTV